MSEHPFDWSTIFTMAYTQHYLLTVHVWSCTGKLPLRVCFHVLYTVYETINMPKPSVASFCSDQYICIRVCTFKHKTYIHTYMCLYKLELSVCFCTMVVFCIRFQYSNFSAVPQSKNSDFSSYNVAVLERQRVVCSRQVMKSIFWVIFRYAFQWTSVLYMKRFIIISILLWTSLKIFAFYSR